MVVFDLLHGPAHNKFNLKTFFSVLFCCLGANQTNVFKTETCSVLLICLNEQRYKDFAKGKKRTFCTIRPYDFAYELVWCNGTVHLYFAPVGRC